MVTSTHVGGSFPWDRQWIGFERTAQQSTEHTLARRAMFTAHCMYDDSRRTDEKLCCVEFERGASWISSNNDDEMSERMATAGRLSLVRSI